jgi:transcriptional regulator with XRE-family HTH domain
LRLVGVLLLSECLFSVTGTSYSDLNNLSTEKYSILHKFIERLRMLMEERDLSQTQVGDMASTSQSTVHRWLEGTAEPEISELEALCAGLGIELTIGGKDDENRMELRETDGLARDLAVWRGRAKRAEKELADLKEALRKLSGCVSLERPSDVEVLAVEEGERIDREHRKR